MVVRTVLGIVELPNNVKQDNVQNLPLIVNGHLGVHGLHVLTHVEMGKKLKLGLCLVLQEMVVGTVSGIVE